MLQKSRILKGAFILTVTGFISRIIGFVFRMFLSHTFGEELVGLYQLIFPIYALCFSFTAAGIETAISRSIARAASMGQHAKMHRLLYSGIALSLSLSVITMLVLQNQATAISEHILGDTRCTSLLITVSYALPFAAIHSCICGYYLGLKQTKVPALSQLIEQLVRVGSVYVFFQIGRTQEEPAGILCAVLGLVLGEIASCILCVHYIGIPSRPNTSFRQLRAPLTELLTLAIPLTANRILLNLLQSLEAISIPSQLRQYGYSAQEALSIYGVFTGMALPCILFPSAITNSFSTMLLPTVAEIQAATNASQLKLLIRKVILSCFTLGFASCLIFLVCGQWMGQLLFHSPLAGDFILTLAWICPFLYTNTALVSIINGLGKANTSFSINSSGLILRILSVFVAIPQLGINGYLYGLLFSQLWISIFCLVVLIRYLSKPVKTARAQNS